MRDIREAGSDEEFDFKTSEMTEEARMRRTKGRIEEEQLGID